MTDARLPSRWLMNVGIMALTDRAWRVFTSSLMWANEQGTDGVIPKIAMRLLHPEDVPDQVIDELVNANLVQRNPDGGMSVLKWEETQSSAATVEHQRELNRERQRAYREREKKNLARNSNASGTRRVTPAVTRDVTQESPRRGQAGEEGQANYGNQETYSGPDRDRNRELVVTEWPVVAIPGSGGAAA